ncbi:hypothetical protein [Caldisericum sp.]
MGEKREKKENEKIICLTCEVCGKKIISLYPKQAENNMKIHKTTHEITH